MEMKDDESKALRLRVEQISAELDKQDRVRVVNTKWMLTVGAVIVAALGYTNFVQLPAEAAKAAREQVGPEIVNNANAIVKNLEEKKNEINKIESITSHLVISGGIIAWHPGEQYIERTREGTKIKAPDGWAICDGKNGTPDLRGQFLRGLPSDVSVADFLKNPARSAGRAVHDHGEHDHGKHYHKFLRHDDKEKPKYKYEDDDYPLPWRGSTVALCTAESTVPAASIRKANHLPPYVNVVYIMRLGAEKGAGNTNRL